MTEISFKLEQFEGPLDLLLHLISKHKLNIYDISISVLVEQYLDYIEKMNEQDMEVTGDFLEMAARLIYIKTVSLLPKHEEADVMKKELEGRLIEHSLCKRAAEILSKRYCGDSVFVREPLKIDFDNTYRMTHEKEELFDAWMGINIKKEDAAPVKIQSFGKIVSKRMVSVTSKIIYVLRKLYTSGSVMMNSLYAGMTDKSERVATFLAVLELTKAGRITISDDNEIITFNGKNKEEAPVT